MASKTFKAISLADLHCGCPRIDPFHFQACIEKYVLPQITQEVTHLFICGDFFDLLINMNSVASMVAMTVISELKQACATTGTKLRVLRGTFTHDRNQPKHFLITSPEYNSCVKLFDTLSIEYDEDLGMNFLYMPDNLPYENIYDEVEKLLEAHALKQVDAVIHHGYFKHMLPPGIPEPNGTLDYDIFKKFYTGCVLNGHVHIRSIYNNVVSIGSFDRMAYGEEEAKGFYLIEKKDDIYQFTFIENKDAQPFITISMNEFNSESIQAAVDYFSTEWLPKLRTSERMVHIRILADDPGVVEAVKTVANEQLRNVIVDRGAVTKREQLIQNLNLDLHELVEITPENLGELLLPIVQKQHPLVDPQEIAQVLAELKGDK